MLQHSTPPRLGAARHLSIVAALALASLVLPAAALAQSEESENAPAAGQFEPAPLPPATYLIPDVSPAAAKKTEVKARWFTMKVGFVLIVDYDAFVQDAASLSQVGEQDDQWDDRALRLMFRGGLGKATYLLAGEYKGFDTAPEQNWVLSDAAIALPLGGPQTKLTLGKTKETFGYEMVGDAANLQPLERVLNPFFVSRNFGAKLTRVFGKLHRMTASAGVYNDWLFDDRSFSQSGTDVTGRLTGLVVDADEGRRYFHVGIAARYAGFDDGQARYKGRPESNVTAPYLDTGTMSADHAWNGGLEALWTNGPFSALAEYNRSWVRSSGSGSPAFDGFYVTGSWVLTGEHRPYDRTVGYARRVMPRGRWGAPELVVRYSHEDLDAGLVHGGYFDKTYLGVNWWATRRWKIGTGWGHTWLRRFGTTGVTDSFQTRVQWVY